MGEWKRTQPKIDTRKQSQQSAGVRCRCGELHLTIRQALLGSIRGQFVGGQGGGGASAKVLISGVIRPEIAITPREAARLFFFGEPIHPKQKTAIFHDNKPRNSFSLLPTIKKNMTKGVQTEGNPRIPPLVPRRLTLVGTRPGGCPPSGRCSAVRGPTPPRWWSGCGRGGGRGEAGAGLMSPRTRRLQPVGEKIGGTQFFFAIKLA